MSVKHDLTEPDKSSRPQKRMTPASSSDSPSSPGFSATATSPALSRPFFPLPSFDPALFNTPDVDISNYTTLATATSSETREDMDHMEEIQKMALPHESVEDYITSVTPVRSTADSAIDNDIDFLDNSPRSIGSPTSPTASDGALELTKEPRSISEGTRQDMYRQSFQGKEVELHKMRLPDMCAMLPDHADEVIQAYLTHTRFTANIWANYDSVDKELYLWEDQIKSCGKLVLFPTQLKMLEKLDPKVYQFMKVRLNIGTPFRTLFVLYIDSVPEKTNNPDSEWRLAGRVEFCDDPRGPHYILENVLRIAYRNIEEDGVAKGQHGLTFNDLQAIAAEFLYKPKDLVAEWKSKLANGGGSGSTNGFSNSNGFSNTNSFRGTYGSSNTNYFTNANGYSSRYGSGSGSGSGISTWRTSSDNRYTPMATEDEDESSPEIWWD